MSATEYSPRAASPARLRWEIGIVLALSFGMSALYALANIAERVTRETNLNEQTTTIHRTLSERPVFDLIFQLLNVASGLAPVALVVWLLWRTQRPHMGRLGIPIHSSFNRTSVTPQWWIRDTAWGIALAAGIGIPGIAFYLGSKALGLNLTVIPTALDTYPWTLALLVLHALNAALGEELIVVAYLFDRMKRLGHGVATIIICSAVLRGTYHLYQGFGGFAGNVIMGLIFGWIYARTGKILPLIVAHLVLDIVSFAGFPLALALWPALFGVPATL